MDDSSHDNTMQDFKCHIFNDCAPDIKGYLKPVKSDRLPQGVLDDTTLPEAEYNLNTLKRLDGYDD